MTTPVSNPPCAELCARAMDRRVFLRDAAVAAGAALLALGAAPEVARAALAGELSSVAGVADGGATRSYAIPAVDGASVDEEAELILVRWGGVAYAFALACPHRGARLVWHASESRVFCPKHKARFRPDGAHDSGRKTRALDRHDVRREGSRLVVQLDVRRRVDQDPAAWEAAAVRLV